MPPTRYSSLRLAIDGRACRQGALRTAVIFAASAACVWGFSTRYQVGVDGQRDPLCLPYRVFLIDKWDKDLERGELFAFRTMTMEPFVANGTTVIKTLRGMPGDEIRVDGEVYVNGVWYGELLDGHLQKIGKSAADLVRVQIVPPGHLFAMGEHPRSYDSRYWGFVEQELVVGRAYGLW
jgi:conjugal transfer pilin signal peptidase TrbI